MKHLLIIIFFLFISCNKDYQYNFTNGKGTATKDNVGWAAEAEAYYYDGSLDIDLYQKNKDGVINDHIRFSIPFPPTLGIHELKKHHEDSSYYFNSNFLKRDGSNIIALYMLNEPSNSEINIISYNPQTKWLYATFNTSYYRDTSYSVITRLPYPDSLKFTNGKIDVLLMGI